MRGFPRTRYTGPRGARKIAGIPAPALSRAVALLLFAFATTCSASGAPQGTGAGDPRGMWVNDKKKVGVRIEDCDGLLCGRIVWLKKPQDAGGRSKRDRHNPDAALRDRPLCGLKILGGFRRVAENTWSDGQIYDPSDGRTYSSTLTLASDGTLQVRGYLGLSLFGKTVAWARTRDRKENCGQPGKDTPG